MDRFQKFLSDIRDVDPVVESVERLYGCLLEGNFNHHMSMPADSIRSVTADPRSGFANKIVPTANGTSAPDYIGDTNTSTVSSRTARDVTEENREMWSKEATDAAKNSIKPPKPQKGANKDIRALIDRAKEHLPNPVAMTISALGSTPACGYTIKTGVTGNGYPNAVGFPTQGGSDSGGGGGGSAGGASAPAS